MPVVLGLIAFIVWLFIAAWDVITDAPLRAQIFVGIIAVLSLISFTSQFVDSSWVRDVAMTTRTLVRHPVELMRRYRRARRRG